MVFSLTLTHHEHDKKDNGPDGAARQLEDGLGIRDKHEARARVHHCVH
jgi:hypothetical protein